MVRLNLYDYSHSYIHVREPVTVPNSGIAANNRNKKVIF